MSVRYLGMWALLFLLVLGVAVDWVKFGNPFGSIFDAFPSDSSRKEALRRCDLASTSFSRFSARDRDTCYRTMIRAKDSAP
jgi:hypothetical protein